MKNMKPESRLFSTKIKKAQLTTDGFTSEIHFDVLVKWPGGLLYQLSVGVENLNGTYWLCEWGVPASEMKMKVEKKETSYNNSRRN